MKKEKREKLCEYCEMAAGIINEDYVLCNKNGVVRRSYCCRKFTFDPMKIHNVKTVRNPALDEVEEEADLPITQYIPLTNVAPGTETESVTDRESVPAEQPTEENDAVTNRAEEAPVVEDDSATVEKEDEAEPLPPEEKKKAKPKKRMSAGKKFILAVVLILLVSVVCVGTINIFYCMNNIEVNFYNVEATKHPAVMNVAVLSDIHLKEYGENNSELIRKIKSLSPDLIISAGDMVTYAESDYSNMISLTRTLSEIAPFYGVMGNHEDEKIFLDNDTSLVAKFTEAGMHVLRNEIDSITINGYEVEIVGISGNSESFDNYGGKELMQNLEDSRAYRIVVCHVPTVFEERLSDYNFDLGIAGHTHGGTIRLPKIGGLYSAEEGFRPVYDGGLYDLTNGAKLIVSRGLGSANNIPRFNNTPEIAVVKLSWLY